MQRYYWSIAFFSESDHSNYRACSVLCSTKWTRWHKPRPIWNTCRSNAASAKYKNICILEKLWKIWMTLKYVWPQGALLKILCVEISFYFFFLFDREKVFSPQQGSRPNVKKVLIVITDGASNDRENLKGAVEQAKNKSIARFVIGVSTSVI